MMKDPRGDVSMPMVFIPLTWYSPSTRAVPSFSTEILFTSWVRVVSFNFPCRSPLTRFLISERLRITDPVGCDQNPVRQKKFGYRLWIVFVPGRNQVVYDFRD